MSDAWKSPLEHPRRLVRLVQLAWRWIAQESIPQMAAALAYRSIFSLIPLVLLAFLIVQLVQKDMSLVEDLLRKILHMTGLDQVKVDPSTFVGPVQPGEAMASASGFDLEIWLRGVLKEFSKVSLTGIGLITGVTLVYAAFSLLVEVEKSFNRVYGAASSRSWARRFTQYWLVLSLGPVLMYASFVTAEQFSSIATNITERGSSLLGSWLVSFSGFVTSVVISSALLALLYSTVPNTRVRVRPALIGAASAAVALELAKYGFRFYLARAGFQSLYGALAVLPLFLLWLYLTWFIVLAGLRISFIVQHGSHGLLIHLWRDSGMERSGLLGSAWIDPASAVNVMIEVAQGFRAGRPRPAEAIADNLGLDALLVRRVLARLVERQLLVRVSSGRSDSYTLARPADLIATADVLNVGFDLAGPLDSGAGSEFIGRMRAAQIKAADGVMLAELVAPQQVPASSKPPAANTLPSDQPASQPLLGGGNS